MQTRQGLKNNLWETAATLGHDNLSNLSLFIIATQLLHYPIVGSVFLWVLGQTQNGLFSFIRRCLFDKYTNKTISIEQLTIAELHGLKKNIDCRLQVMGKN